MSSLQKLDPSQRRIGKLLQFSPPIHKMPANLARIVFKGFNSLFGLPKQAVKRVAEYHVAVAKSTEKIKLRVYYPEQATAVTVYYHGGGCVIGDINSYDNFCRMLANQSEQIIISVDYRLAPEHKFPTPIIDAVASWNWVITNTKRLGIEGMKVGVAGDSAGGYLAAAIGLTCVQDTLPEQALTKPDFQFLIYPVTDQNTNNHGSFPQGVVLTNPLVEYFKAHYLNSYEEASEPLASLVLAPELSQSPRTHLLTVEFDPLCNTGKDYLAALENAGVKVKHSHLEDCMHGFISVAKVSSRAREACLAIATELSLLARGE